jgi:hypothetical protein
MAASSGSSNLAIIAIQNSRDRPVLLLVLTEIDTIPQILQFHSPDLIVAWHQLLVGGTPREWVRSAGAPNCPLRRTRLAVAGMSNSGYP